jgi:RimJ/RimL family protein N-acetyltransferase
MKERYACLDLDEVVLGARSLVPLRHEDILNIMLWRNAQMKVLRQRELLTIAKQEQYFREVISPSYVEMRPRQILFSYLNEGVLIGYGGLVHISWEDRRAEVSFLLSPARAADAKEYEQDFSCYLAMIQTAAFQYLKFTRLFTETYDIRRHHVSILESSGFELEGRLKSHVWIDNKPVDSLLHGCVRPLYGSA